MEPCWDWYSSNVLNSKFSFFIFFHRFRLACCTEMKSTLVQCPSRSPEKGRRWPITAYRSTQFNKTFSCDEKYIKHITFQGYFALSGLRASRFPMDLLAFAQVFTKRSWLVLSLLGIFACGAIALAAKMSKREKMHRRVTFKNWISIMF